LAPESTWAPVAGPTSPDPRIRIRWATSMSDRTWRLAAAAIAVMVVACSGSPPPAHRSSEPGGHVPTPVIDSRATSTSWVGRIRHLRISSRAGPVGTVVTISGLDCRSGSGQQDTLLWGIVLRLPSAIPTQWDAFGSVSVRSVRLGVFSATFRIPSKAGQINAMGGGSILPGDAIEFRSAPPVCRSNLFRVTAGD